MANWTTDDSYNVDVNEKISLPNPRPWLDNIGLPSGWNWTGSEYSEGEYYDSYYSRSYSKDAGNSGNADLFISVVESVEGARSAYDMMNSFPPSFDTQRTSFIGDESREVYNSRTITTFIIWRGGNVVFRVQTNAGSKSESRSLADNFSNEAYNNAI